MPNFQSRSLRTPEATSREKRTRREVTRELPRGTLVANYRVEAVLGRGGMSVVYLAEDLRLKRRVALKLLAPALAEDARFRERFLNESELAASLDHANVIPIYEAGEVEGTCTSRCATSRARI